MKHFLTTLLVLFCCVMAKGADVYTSVAGFGQLDGSGRLVWNFNPGWRFCLGDVKGAETIGFDDSQWQVVATPHCVKLEPAEASGCRNYQGKAWYRKHFVMPKETAGKDVTLHFEAIMGKQQFYINGKLVKEHLGGFLPVNISLTDCGVKPGEKCVVAVMADNSDDGSYPPGKPQVALDFAYHGGIYRDVWMIAKSKVAITDAVDAGKVAGGGVFVHYENITEHNADVYVNTEVHNAGNKPSAVKVTQSLTDMDGRRVAFASSSIVLQAGETKSVSQRFKVRRPHLWSPETPYLYRLQSRVIQGKNCLDGGVTRIGIRSFEFKGKDGFWLNGKRYHQLIGGNRHQDFAYVGNAMPNSQQWRDALRLRNAGFTIVRTAHYPQDPAFMDACDELGLFVIVATPGWQFWNKDPKFAAMVQQNTRDLIRRDRNHPSVLMWEPILNETHFPKQFALDALQVTKEEYPFAYRPVSAADLNSAGVRDNYDLVYGWPIDEDKKNAPKQCIFTREFGEYVDDWYAHNAMNRASRSWGERAMKVQAEALTETIDLMYHTKGQFIGGCQWHPFDHQRGYHPDPFWGGIYDAFRQKKYAYYLFHSQMPATFKSDVVESGPMVYMMHEMTPSSEPDVTVYSNGDSVRLSIYDGAKSWTLPVEHQAGHMPNNPVVFKDVWHFMDARSYSYNKKSWQKVNLVAEGIIGGKVVCTDKRMPSRRSTKLRLYADTMGKNLVADGSDFVVVVAEVTDDSGNVRRLAKEDIVFSVEGEGEIVGGAENSANPRAVEWGSAPVLVRSTCKAGAIKIHARVLYPGMHAPADAELVINSVPCAEKMCYDVTEVSKAYSRTKTEDKAVTQQEKVSEQEKQKLLREVEQQQADFGIHN